MPINAATFNKLFYTVGWGLYNLIEKTPSNRAKSQLRELSETQFRSLESLRVSKRQLREICYALGVVYCYSRPSQPKKSETYLKRAMRLSTTRRQKAQIINALGNVYFETRKYKKALSYFEKALALMEHKSIPLYNISFVYEKMRDRKKAIRAALASIRAMSDEADLRHTTNPRKELGRLIKRCRS